jgi:hypothetical protein
MNTTYEEGQAFNTLEVGNNTFYFAPEKTYQEGLVFINAYQAHCQQRAMDTLIERMCSLLKSYGLMHFKGALSEMNQLLNP